MLYRRGIDRILIVIVPIAIFVYFSTQPQLRLRRDMPKGFAAMRPSQGPGERAQEERLAQAYWTCALDFIQWEYTYAASLPEAPPDDFKAQLSKPSIVSTSRQRYWRRLRRVWLLRSTWIESRQWSTDWLTAPITKMLDRFALFVSDLFRKA